MNKTLLKVLAFINAVFITIPFLFFVYPIVFPIIYFFQFITTKDEAVYFYGFWIIELILTVVASKFLYKIFNERRRIYVIILTPCTFIVFLIFGINVFPHYSEFPAESTQDIIKRDSVYVTKAIANATNKHPLPSSYNSDKLMIEEASKRYLDSITKIPRTNLDPHENYRAYALKLDSPR